MASTEDIEAKLAAYVDGEIDPAGRAEIEKHLANNPQHRQLIAELMGQRDLLRGLPREAAPPDVAESLNAQLERAVLLGDVDGESDGASLRINRWPQIRAVAAVLLLAGGLFMAVYYLLPSPNIKPPELADLRALPTTTVSADARQLETLEPSRSFSLDSDWTSRDDVGARSRREPDPVGSEQERRVRNALAGVPDAGSDLSTTNTALPGERMFQEIITSTLNSEYGQPAGQMLVVIPAGNVEDANQRVTEVLRQNGIRWEQREQSIPLSLQTNPNQAVFGARRQYFEVALKTAPTTAPLADAQAARPIETPTEALAREGIDGTTPIEADAESQASQVIIARAVPRRQAMQIRDALDAVSRPAPPAQSFPEQHNFQMLPATSAPTTLPAEGASARAHDAAGEKPIALEPLAAATQLGAEPQRIAVGDIVTIEIPQLVGPGVQPLNRFRIDSAGTIVLPMLEPIDVLGRTTDEVAQVVRESYRRSNALDDPQASVALEHPAIVPPLNLGLPLFSEQTEFGLSLPTPRPSMDVVDMVILVQNPQLAAPATQPADSVEPADPTTLPTDY